MQERQTTTRQVNPPRSSSCFQSVSLDKQKSFGACAGAKMAGLSFKDWNSRMDLFADRQDVEEDDDDEEDEDSVWTPAYGFPYSSEDNLFLASTALSGKCFLSLGSGLEMSSRSRL